MEILHLYSTSQIFLLIICSYLPIYQIQQSEVTEFSMNSLRIKLLSTFVFILKGWLTVFFLGLIVFMGCSLACVHAWFLSKHIIFHIIYLYSTPLCPFSDKRLDLFPGFMKLLLQKYAMGWDWLAGSVCCDWLNRLYCTSERPAPLLSGMCSGWIVNSSVVYNAYQFEPDWDPEDISEEDRAEPVQARLLMVCLVVVVSYF